MRPHTVRTTFVGLLLITMVLLASGCASDGSYSGQASVGVYGYGYYGGYPGYYGGDVIVGAPMPPPGGVRPPGAMPPPGARPPAPPPQVSQLPSRPMPAPAPRPMPARGGGGRR
jgi:splicing factor 1